jgi:ketosteroid isomerase-like protein
MGEAADVVRSAFGRFNAGDLDGMTELLDRDVEFHELPTIPGSGTYRGPDGVRRWAETVVEPFEELRFGFEDAEERGEWIAVETFIDGRGRGSGAAVQMRMTTVWRVRDGAIVYHHGYRDRAEALRAIEAGAASREGA